MFQTNFQGSDIIQNYVSRVDRFTRRAKNDTYKKCADLLTASLVIGAANIDDLIRRDERVREKWGIGSEEKARNLLAVWAGSTLFAKCQFSKFFNGEFRSDDLLETLSILCMYDHDDKVQGEALLKAFYHFNKVYWEERRSERVNLEWPTLLCLRTFRALEDASVPPELDFSTSGYEGTDLAHVFGNQDRVSPAANEEAFQQFTEITRLGLFEDIFRVGLIGFDESYDSLKNRKKSFWSKLRG